jgi:transposase
VKSRKLPDTNVSDAFWAEIEPLLPPKPRTEGRVFRRRPGAGRKTIPARNAFAAIMHVLRTGMPWKALPKKFGSASAVHRQFDAWHEGGLFIRIWQSGLAEHDEMEGIPWQWQRSSDLESIEPVHPRLWQPSRARRRKPVSFKL